MGKVHIHGYYRNGVILSFLVFLFTLSEMGSCVYNRRCPHAYYAMFPILVTTFLLFFLCAAVWWSYTRVQSLTIHELEKINKGGGKLGCAGFVVRKCPFVVRMLMVLHIILVCVFLIIAEFACPSGGNECFCSDINLVNQRTGTDCFTNFQANYGSYFGKVRDAWASPRSQNAPYGTQSFVDYHQALNSATSFDFTQNSLNSFASSLSQNSFKQYISNLKGSSSSNWGLDDENVICDSNTFFFGFADSCDFPGKGTQIHVASVFMLILLVLNILSAVWVLKKAVIPPFVYDPFQEGGNATLNTLRRALRWVAP
eukprot:GEMP01051797.1.p1 GENE.GEMP01051797.1~~GEMP01051797.1.p1  ORF type:complete len:313 (+),score=42.64 GEMP01051797.1:465-1403(+)